MSLLEITTEDFITRFNKKPSLFVAPGRINLIGEHTDYNEGFVMPAAIDKHIVFAMAPSGNDRCNIFSKDLEEGVTFSIYDLNPGEVWINYLMGVIDAFQRRGLPVRGVDCVFAGDIPVGGGMSSSAALCCGFGFALNEVFQFGISRLEIAKIAQSSEHHFVGAMVGIMDQYASLFSKKDAVLLLDCKKLTHVYFPFHFPDMDIVLVDTKVKHAIASSAYNDRREACEQGVTILNKRNSAIHSLRDATRAMLFDHQDELGEDVFVKCLYVVDENLRVQKASDYLKEGNLKAFGDLMYQTHWGLSQAYEVSCPELDFLVSLAEEQRSDVIGSRMMGGGFGGCTINLVQKEKVKVFKEMVLAKYFATFKKEPDFYSVKLSDGVHSVSV
jgi:galactokinase